MAFSWEFRIYDRENFMEIVEGLYNVDNSVKPLTEDKSTRAYFSGSSSDEFTQAFMSVSTPLRLVADTAAFMVATCNSGGLQFKGKNGTYDIPVNSSMCLSPNDDLDAITEPDMASTVTHLNTDRVHKICSAWLGSALDEPLKLEEGAFSPMLHEQWTRAAKALELVHSNKSGTDWVFYSIEEYAVSLLLHGKNNNYSRFLARTQAISPRIAADAYAFIQENAGQAIAPSDVAAFLGCSLSALGRGFREHIGITLRECIYAARVAQVHRMFADSTVEAYNDILRRSGFINIARFNAIYERMFYEAPTDTWQRHALLPENRRTDRLSAEKIERLRSIIQESLAKPIKIEELASITGLAPTQFRVLFKNAFGLTPNQYILQERVNWARWLLSNTDKSLTTIAAEAGFGSQSYFTEIFKRFTGTTPREFRNSC
ncbi:helix-turn-helix domain-containing protein [Ochrobactrum soli]|uniref:Helix-turn-helix domain-containing protein n=1 Tax=Ochrobactrum soli TaxID=2448455 RepID=A0A849KZ69_9HYPH|nr:helix-turn-helix domain-containing protein [[Ochrobactrum] soli]NNU63606.1 helix-turn-helix domain-containing protein [[Ochrobactrum] soli]